MKYQSSYIVKNVGNFFTDEALQKDAEHVSSDEVLMIMITKGTHILKIRNTQLKFI